MVFCSANQSTSRHVAPGTRSGVRYQPISVFNSETRNCVVFCISHLKSEDVGADVDLNVVMNGKLELIEIQGTAESNSMTRSQLNKMLDLAEKGIEELLAAQQEALLSNK